MFFPEKNFVETLRARLAEPLPGQAAQFKMAFKRRILDAERYASPENPKIAAVLHLLHWRDGAWRTMLIRRVAHPLDRHGGQISFPGGRFEESDGDLAVTALRETEEEIGIPASQIELLGRLTELYIPVSNFLVHPFVGVLRGDVELRPQPGEVEAVLTPAMADFHQLEARKIMDLTIGEGVVLREVPYFEVEGHVVWGATAMILSEFLEVLNH